MLFNKSNNGAEELQQRTGSYFANNDFARIETDVILAEEDMAKLVGADVMLRAADHYNSSSYEKSSPSAEEAKNDKLVRLLQIPIAYNATFAYYQSNLVSHKDTGRKVSVDNENEKMAWEWMLDRDDEAQIRKANKTTDMLISWLELQSIPEWMNSENRVASRQLFVNTEAIFQDGYPIDLSPRFFYTVLPFNKEVQTMAIRKALGSKYQELLDYHIGLVSSEGSSSAGGGIPPAPETALLDQLLPLVQKTIPLLTMAMAVKRLSLQVLPEGVVQQYKSETQARSSSSPALKDIIEWHVKKLKDDANDHLNDIKIILQSADPLANTYRLVPENVETNKFFRT